MKNTKPFFKLHPTKYKDFMQEDFEKLSKRFVLSIQGQKVYYRAKKNVQSRKREDYANFVASEPTRRVKRERFIRRFKKLFALLVIGIVCDYWIAYFFTIPEVYAETSKHARSFFVDADVSKVTFAKWELEELRENEEIETKANWGAVEWINEVFKEDADWAFRCLQSENASLNPQAENLNRNGTVDRGIFQINTIHCGKVDGSCLKLFDVETNVRVAKMIFDTQGKGAWYGSTCR